MQFTAACHSEYLCNFLIIDKFYCKCFVIDTIFESTLFAMFDIIFVKNIFDKNIFDVFLLH